MARKPQPKPLTRADVAAMDIVKLLATAKARGNAALWLAANHPRRAQRLIRDADLCQDEIDRRNRAIEQERCEPVIVDPPVPEPDYLIHTWG